MSEELQNNEVEEKVVDVTRVRMAELIRRTSSRYQLTKEEAFAAEPISLTGDELKEKIAALLADEEYKDIGEIKGKKGNYYYSEKYMVRNYAIILARIEDRDLLALIAETVREESRVYPRPTDLKLFYEHPFNLNKNVLEEALKRLGEDPRYPDIRQTKCSNGAIFLYSDLYMHPDQAAAQAEWIEVLIHENP